MGAPRPGLSGAGASSMGRSRPAAMAMAALALPVLLTGAALAWTAARAPLPADAAASGPLASIWDVSCRPAATCAAAGYYTDVAGDRQALPVPGPRGGGAGR